MNTIRILYIIILLANIQQAHASFDPNINIRVSFKIVVNPNTGLPPTTVNPQTIQTIITVMNLRMDSYWRGYSFVATDISNVGSLNGFWNGPSRWYATNFFAQPNLKKEMELEAKANPALYLWRNDAINIYITTGFSGGVCSFGEYGDEIILIDDGFLGFPDGVLHEIGHYFDLKHTHNGCSSCVSGSSLQCGTNCAQSTCISNDQVADTYNDHPCWNFQDIATHNNITLPCSPIDSSAIQAALQNVMSYHHISSPPQLTIRLTEGQLNKWAASMDNINHPNRRNVRTASSLLVSAYTPPTQVGSLLQATQNIKVGDIIYLLPALYPEGATPLVLGVQTHQKGITLRATRAGAATIGD